MVKEGLVLGVMGIILGISIFIKTSKIIAALIPFLIGIALIALRNQENKIEERKDKSKKRNNNKRK